jgi:hypothetical protein
VQKVKSTYSFKAGIGEQAYSADYLKPSFILTRKAAKALLGDPFRCEERSTNSWEYYYSVGPNGDGIDWAMMLSFENDYFHFCLIHGTDFDDGLIHPWRFIQSKRKWFRK